MIQNRAVIRELNQLAHRLSLAEYGRIRGELLADLERMQAAGATPEEMHSMLAKRARQARARGRCPLPNTPAARLEGLDALALKAVDFGSIPPTDELTDEQRHEVLHREHWCCQRCLKTNTLSRAADVERWPDGEWHGVCDVHAAQAGDGA